MIISTNLNGSLGSMASTAVSPTARQTSDFLAFLETELSKVGAAPGSAAAGDPLSRGVPAETYVKPASVGAPVVLERPGNATPKPMSVGAPDIAGSKTMSWGVPDAIERPAGVTIKPMSWGVPTETSEELAEAQEPAVPDGGAPSEKPAV